MFFHDKSTEQTLRELNVDINTGLTSLALEKNRKKFGFNQITKNKNKNLFKRILSALKEPMLIILLFGFCIAFGSAIGKFIKSGENDFYECIGIFSAIALSVAITVIMESSSQKAFEALGKLYEGSKVRVIRQGVTKTISQKEVAVGDIILVESGEKIVADCRILKSNGLMVDESSLTGESVAVSKNAQVVLKRSKPLAERENCLYSGTYVTEGDGKAVVTAIGDKTEIGKLAKDIQKEDEKNSPLQNKLAKLGKTITIIGAITSSVVFILSLIRLAIQGDFNFLSVQELFISCIVLIIAAVPEGLPTIVAVSLALNMIKLAKQNALIKKMTATETAGAVSIICSDKTGTLTQNKMTVEKVCLNEFCLSLDKVKAQPLLQNFVCNSTADLIKNKGKIEEKGSQTECALLKAYQKSNSKVDYKQYRESFIVKERQPFSSDKKQMSTTIIVDGKERLLVKGAPEKIINICSLTTGQKLKILADVERFEKNARRVICFAHCDENEKFVFDGYVSIVDPIRKEVYNAIKVCKRANIKVKILTGDNKYTAYSIAKELQIATDLSQVVSANDIENLDDEAFNKVVERVSVIARSTPLIKLRVVKALKSMGEVVAVTGDGINDAPAIKQADVGISMGLTGSEITKKASDVVLLDDSFSTVVKAIAFGRNVYKNLQRFILFQLSVNVSALLFITACAILGVETPFTTLQLLWINVIMDGPPAITLGLEKASNSSMDDMPVKRNKGIVSKSMLIRIIFNGVFVGVIMILQYVFNFLAVKECEKTGVTFTLFILFQLFNAFNSRELGSKSIFNGLGKNKIMLATFGAVFCVHVFIVQVCYKLFGVSPICFLSWVKTILTALTLVIVSEGYKWLYRFIKRGKKFKSVNKKTGRA